MQVSEFQLFQILREKVGDEQAKTLAEYVETKVEYQVTLKSKNLETNSTRELLKLKTEFYLEINKRRVETIQLLFFVVIVLILISTMLVGFSK